MSCPPYQQPYPHRNPSPQSSKPTSLADLPKSLKAGTGIANALLTSCFSFSVEPGFCTNTTKSQPIIPVSHNHHHPLHASERSSFLGISPQGNRQKRTGMSELNGERDIVNFGI